MWKIRLSMSIYINYLLKFFKGWRKGWRSLISSAFLALIGNTFLYLCIKKITASGYTEFEKLFFLFGIFFSALLPSILWSVENWILSSIVTPIPLIFIHLSKWLPDYLAKIINPLALFAFMLSCIMLCFRGGCSINQALIRTGGFLFGSMISLIIFIEFNTLNCRDLLFINLVGIIITESVFTFDLIWGNSLTLPLSDNTTKQKIVKKDFLRIFFLFFKTIKEKIAKNDYLRIFSLFLIPTKIMRIFSMLCFVMGVIATLYFIMEKTESIITKELLTLTATVRPEMIILPIKNSRHHISKNINNSKTLAISKTEITFENYFFVVGGNIEDIKNKAIMNKPITDKNSIDPRLYCNILSRIEGLKQCYYSNKKDIRKCKGYRLPTKNEWMYAACAYNNTFFHSYLLSLGWFSNNTVQVHDVAKKKANAWGLHDTFGNVSELVHPSPYNADNSNSFTHIGCSFMDEISDYCTDDHKTDRLYPKSGTIGFRIVRSIFPE